MIYAKYKVDRNQCHQRQQPLLQASIAKLAKGDKESGVAAAQKIMTFAKAGVDVSKQQQAWVANAKAGERFLTQSVYTLKLVKCYVKIIYVGVTLGMTCTLVRRY